MSNRIHIRTGLHLLLVLALLVSSQAALAAPVTYADISDCVNTEGDITCVNKTSITLEVGNGDGVTLDTRYYMPTVPGDPIQFRVSKTEPALSYPLRYLHTVDYAPHEELIKVVNSRPGIAACLDGVDATAPTCGWQLDTTGNKIADSQGFCSNRNLLQLKTTSDPNGWWRGEKELGVQSTQAASFSIGHCLRQSSVSYRGYEIDPPRRDYTINVAYSGTESGSFILSPGGPVYAAVYTAHQFKAQLAGEDQPAAVPPDLSGFILYVPTAPANDPKVLDWKNNMLLVPRNMVTVNGSECDKVGVSYSAFRGEGGTASKSVAGACLGNQLKQLHGADLARLAANPAAETDYLLKGKRLFKDGLAAMTGLALKVTSPELVYSRVALLLDRAEVGVTAAESTGVIVSAGVATHTAPSRDGALLATIRNSGRLTADYLVTVGDCTPGIRGSIPAMARTLNAGEEALLTFPLQVESALAGSHSCRITLTAPGGSSYGEQTVSFTTSAVNGQTPQKLLLPNNDTTVKP